ncbi:protease, partial [bacterium]
MLLLPLGLLQVPTNQGYYMQPAIRGDQIVFVAQGALWRVGSGGGQAQMLTSRETPASNPAISPDGKTLAFTGSYEGPTEAYTMSLEGDLPSRLTYRGRMNVTGWTPDGRVLVSTDSLSTLPQDQLAAIDPKTHRLSLFPLAQASDGDYDGTTKTLFFTRLAFQGSHTKRYEGGTAQGLWKYTDGAPEAVNLTKDFKGTSKTPMVWNGRVYFLSDRDGAMNLWSMNPDGGGLKQHTKHAGWDIQSASLDKGRVVYQLGADIHLFDVAKGEDKTLPITLATDFEGTRERWQKNPMAYLTAFRSSPDGKKVVLTARGQVFVAPVEKGRFVEATRKPGVRYRSAIFSPDGKWVYALSDQTGETEWWRMPANGVGTPEQVTTGSKVLNTVGGVSPDGRWLVYANKDQELMLVNTESKVSKKIANSATSNIEDFNWSPDSKWIAYSMPLDPFYRIYLYSISSGASTPVTSERSDAYNPAWSPDGKWLYFLSDRTFRSSVRSPWGPRAPEPFFDRQSKVYAIGLAKGLRSPFQEADELMPAPEKPTEGPVNVDPVLDGIQNRLWEIPVPSGNYADLKTNGERLFLRDSESGGPSHLVAIDITDKDIEAKRLVPGIDTFDLSADGKKLLVLKGGSFFSVAANAGGPAPLTDMVDLSGWSFSVNPREEWQQMFDEAWRLERDYFYDRDMHGVDWKAMRAKYRPLVDRVRDRRELSNLLAQMVGELSALHMFVYGGDLRRSADSINSGMLGGEFVRDEALGGFRIERIYKGDPDYPTTLAPLVRPGVDLEVGDTVLAVNGVDALTAPDLYSLLRNQTGKQVLLHVKERNGKERDVIVKPISSRDHGLLQYADWELSRRQIVDERSKGDIGYLHLQAMGTGDIESWVRDYYPIFKRSGLIIDVRNNGGGNIDSWIIEKLLRKAWFYWQPRVGDPYWNMQYAFRG